MSSPATCGVKGKILIAEDNPINQRVTVHLLAQLGYGADVACDGSEALRLLAENPSYNAILMDLHMPVMDGIEATHAIRKLETPAANVPIIAVTASVLNGQRQACLDAGMNDFIPKPIDQKTFAATLARWVRPYADSGMPLSA